MAVGASLRTFGGVYPGPYRGFYAHCPTYAYYCPWGFTYDSGCFSFAFSFHWSWSWWSPCHSWWWPTYVSCWYPYWYSCWRPSYASWYYPVAYSTVVYRTVYVDEYVDEGAGVQYEYADAQEPAAVPSYQRTLGIAAERYLVLGDRAFREGRYTDAVQFYAKAIELDPDEGALYLVLADALFAAGDYHYAAYAIRKALELDPALAEAAVDKHAFYGDPTDFDHQLRVLEAYLAGHPTDRDARLVLALNYLFGNRPGDALGLLQAPDSAELQADAAAARLRASAERLAAEASEQAKE